MTRQEMNVWSESERRDEMRGKLLIILCNGDGQWQHHRRHHHHHLVFLYDLTPIYDPSALSVPPLSPLPPFAFINNQKGFGFSLGFCNSRLNLIDSPPYPLLPTKPTPSHIPNPTTTTSMDWFFVHTVHIVLLHFAWFRSSSNHCRPTCRQRELIETPGVVLRCALLWTRQVIIHYSCCASLLFDSLTNSLFFNFGQVQL